MTQKKYIEEVKHILASSDGLGTKIDKVSKLKLPVDANPLLVLIHGDSLEMHYEVELDGYEGYDDRSEQTEEDKQQSRLSVAPSIIKKLETYIQDWGKDNRYSYQFELEALYTGLSYSNDSNVEYIQQRHSINAETVNAAKEASRELERHLLDRLIMYENQETGHKLDSVKPIYTIRDGSGKKIASGRLESDDNFAVSTWLNQL